MRKDIGVAKFGGTSVADIFAIQKCINIVKKNNDHTLQFGTLRC